MTASVQKPQRNMLLVTKVAEIVSFESLVSENIYEKLLLHVVALRESYQTLRFLNGRCMMKY